MTVAYYASMPHYRRHLEPIRQITGGPLQRDGRLTVNGTVIVAAHNDLANVEADRIVLVEHGAGQTYAVPHPSYSGGLGRERVDLFVCPSEQVAQRNRDRYPDAQAVAVGCPAMDCMHRTPARPDPDLAVVSFHWDWIDRNVGPEGRSAFLHWRHHLAGVAGQVAAAGLRLALHGHPRIAGQVRATAKRARVEFIPDWDDVLSRAAVYAVDNSSTGPEFASTGRPLVWINSPLWRRHVDLGGRFWEWTDGIPTVDTPDQLADALIHAAQDPADGADARRRLSDSVYAYRDGRAAERAAAAIAALSAVCEVA